MVPSMTIMESPAAKMSSRPTCCVSLLPLRHCSRFEVPKRKTPGDYSQMLSPRSEASAPPSV